jgi:hypothetical protein
VDAYRNKVRSSLIQHAAAEDGEEDAKVDVPAHFQTRPGKGSWLERKNKRSKRDE